MSTLRRLREMWGYRDRIKELEQTLARCDEGWRISVQKHIEDIRRHRATEAERDNLKAERDKLKAERNDLIRKQIDRESRHLKALKNEGLALRSELEAWSVNTRLEADLRAAEDLLDETGEEIKRLSALLGMACKERDEYFDQLKVITEVVRR